MSSYPAAHGTRGLMAWSGSLARLRDRPHALPRRVRRGAGLALHAVGLLLIAEATVTVVWQEPLTALWTRAEQKKLAAELDRSTIPPGSLPARARALERQTGHGDSLGRMVIPRIGAKFVFVEGTATGDLKKGPVHYADTELPG